ncbi:hypothetical protein OZD69_01945, partial [Wolbachia endosymbiont of Drosophila chauvacae]|nr:hypothetical protein [Wolbachia endosymbiont of Drosophila chauvacae]
NGYFYAYQLNKIPGSQCLGTGMTSFLVKIALKSQCSYSCASGHWMRLKQLIRFLIIYHQV